MSRRAERRDEDAIAGESGGRELITRRLPAVELPVARARTREKPTVDAVEPALLESTTNVGADFISRGADGRAGRGDEIARGAAEFPRERCHGDRGYARGEPAPSGVSRRNGAEPCIGDQQRDTVRRLNRKREARVVGNNDVRLHLTTGAASLSGLRFVNGGAVDLADAHEAVAVHAGRARDLRPGIGLRGGRNSQGPLPRCI